jgi:hypothetical protein
MNDGEETAEKFAAMLRVFCPMHADRGQMSGRKVSGLSSQCPERVTFADGLGDVACYRDFREEEASSNHRFRLRVDFA